MDEHTAYADELRAAGLVDTNRWPGFFMRKFKLTYAQAEQASERAFRYTTPVPPKVKPERKRGGR